LNVHAETIPGALAEATGGGPVPRDHPLHIAQPEGQPHPLCRARRGVGQGPQSVLSSTRMLRPAGFSRPVPTVGVEGLLAGAEGERASPRRQRTAPANPCDSAGPPVCGPPQARGKEWQVGRERGHTPAGALGGHQLTEVRIECHQHSLLGCGAGHDVLVRRSRHLRARPQPVMTGAPQCQYRRLREVLVRKNLHDRAETGNTRSALSISLAYWRHARMSSRAIPG